MPGFEHLADKFPQDLADLRTVMLIGRDCIMAQRQRQFTSNQNKQQIASETPLGWCIMGRSTPDLPQHTYNSRKQSMTQNRTHSTPGAQICCAWCKTFTTNKATHPTKHCEGFKQATKADRWEAILSQEICAICLIGSHSPSRCPDYRGEDSFCQRCKWGHDNKIGCRSGF